MKSFKSTLTVTFFVIGNLVGAGFFLMPTSVAVLGFNLVWSWLIGAFIAFIFALIFGKLYVLYPGSRDLSDYFEDFDLKRSIAFLYWIGIVVGNVIVLTMAVAALKVCSFSYSLILGGGLIVLLSFGNYFFTEEDVAVIESFLSFLKFSLLLFIPIVIFISNPTQLSIPVAAGSIVDVLRVGLLSFWSFMGIETAGVFGSGKAARNGLLIGIFACFSLYVLSCFLIVGSVPVSLLIGGQELPLVYLVKFSKFSALSSCIGYLIAFTSIASLYGWFATSSKIALTFAKSGLFPRFFLKVTKSHSSFWGLWGSAFLTFIIFAITSCFNVSQQFELIADFCVNISLIIFALCANVLYIKSDSFIDIALSLIGMIFVIVLLSMNFLFSLFSVFLFVFCYHISRYYRLK